MSDIHKLYEKQVRAVPRELNNELNNIAANLCITKTTLLRKEIRKQLEDMEPRYIIKDEGANIYISGIGPRLDNKLNAIAKDIGITKNSLLKILLYKIAGQYPENMKKPNMGLKP